MKPATSKIAAKTSPRAGPVKRESRPSGALGIVSAWFGREGASLGISSSIERMPGHLYRYKCRHTLEQPSPII
jgi:hypothetical protein